jgi:hypothetical protein
MFDTPLIERPAYSEGAHSESAEEPGPGRADRAPSVEDLSLLTKYIECSKALMASGQTGTPASRYRA